MSEYLCHILILCAIYLLLAQSFNLCFGLGKLFNLAHVSCYAVGAYSVALLSTEYHLSPLWCFLVAAVLSGLFSVVIGALSVKLSSDYFAIGTLALSAVVTALLTNWKSLTRGVLGIPNIPRPTWDGRELIANSEFLPFALSLTLPLLILIWFLMRSSFGRALLAQAEFRESSLSLGIDAGQVRNVCLLVASSVAGIAGAIYAYYLNYVDPSGFGLSEMIVVLTMVIVGRPGSFWGVCCSTLFLLTLPEFLRFVNVPSGILGPIRQMMYALVLLGVVFVNRERLFPIRRQI